MAAMAAITQSEIALIILGGTVYNRDAPVSLCTGCILSNYGPSGISNGPLHHHFELRGWSRVKVVLVLDGFVNFCSYWIVGF